MSTLELEDSITCEEQGSDCKTSSFAVSFSNGIRRIRNISRFLGVTEVVSPVQAARRHLPVSSVVVWGRKQNSERALRYAAHHQLPVLYVEDGWIRSCSANAHSRVCYSLLVDDLGVYYDSTVPSSLERYLNQPDEQFDPQCNAGDLRYAARCRQLMIDRDITKYNFCKQPDGARLHGDGRELVLVLDQTCDDASVRFGGLDAAGFEAMLERAIQENPEARIVVRTHPDVVAGRREGYLQARAKELGIELSADADNPIPWLKRSTVVYAGTSQLGYEALLCGCTVKVAGQPFYAGWGLTEDWQPIERRTARRTLDQLFHATHVHHARYCCPVTGRIWSLRECLDHVCLQQDYFQRNAGSRVCVGITPWKKRYLAQFLRSPDGRLRFSNRNDAAPSEMPLCWSFTDSANGIGRKLSSAGCDQPGSAGSSAFIRVEDGFIRSRGLGSDFVPPASLVIDEMGLYFDAGSPSTLERLLNEYVCSDEELRRARVLRQSILSANLTKYNVGRQEGESVPRNARTADKKRILVVGQVEGDQSILRGGKDVRSNGGLLTAVRKANPDAFIVYKPHPDVVSGNRKGEVNDSILNSCVDRVESVRHFLDCLHECDELHTMTSLSGFEAILRDVPVVTYGMPFYAGWGITTDTLTCARRRGERTVDELVYLCLVAYPHYVDLDSGEFISVEQLIAKMGAEGSDSRTMTGMRWMSKLANVCGALSYRA
ncbi:capsular polysaccharide biosynthesis protein [Granulosicoccus sp. 3-233]|uniref:capsular polysaccharide biosynthesis protein n=1 Tax=Granulosicoccus sp. 3-233 TaxID=3417969 RepID=UPI003D33D9A3